MKFLLAALTLTSVALAAPPPRAKYLSLKKVKPITMTAQEKQAVVTAEVEKGFHVQTNPPGAPNLIPTTLSLIS